MTTTPPSADREALAKIIDPLLYPECAYEGLAARRNTAFAKADAILALLSTPAQGSAGKHSGMEDKDHPFSEANMIYGRPIKSSGSREQGLEEAERQTKLADGFFSVDEIDLAREAIGKAIAALKSTPVSAPVYEARDKKRPIRVHCMGLLIQKATGCSDNQALKAAYDCFDYNSGLVDEAPDGWQMVPILPPDEMLKAGRHEHCPWDLVIWQIYKAMLSAAPKPIPPSPEMDAFCISLLEQSKPTPSDDRDLVERVAKHLAALKRYSPPVSDQTAEDVWASLSGQQQAGFFHTAKALASVGLLQDSAELVRAFDRADDQDWDYLLGNLAPIVSAGIVHPNAYSGREMSGRDRFWKEVLGNARKALSKPSTGRGE